MPNTINSEPQIIVVGYSPYLRGGVTNVTGVLLKNFPNMDLHPSLYCYSPKYKAVAYYLLSILKFIVRISCTKQHRIIHLIIGSKGDAIRSVPFIWLSKMLELKICTQYHTSADIIFSKKSPGVLTAIINSTLKQVDIHCFLSKRLEKGFREIFPNKFQSRVIPNALEKKWLDVDVLIRKKRHRDIVFFGRWSRGKGVKDLIECMVKVKSDVTCEIYTNHLPEKTFEKCKVFPWVTELEVMEIMRTAKLVILPSHAEAYPTVLLEAAACGTPFLASDIAGIPDIVEESGGGRVFEVRNVAMLVKTVDEMLADEEKWKEMSANGKAWVKILAEDKIKRKWADLYRSLGQRGVD